jgi:UDP-N-acetylglucosamine 2-epimerase (non-hydrolysing)
MVVLGTRPEAIKMAPLVAHLAAEPAHFSPRLVVTAQHREMVDQALAVFGLVPDRDLNLMQPGQTLPDLTCRVLTAMTAVLEEEQPDLVLVQGDTTTVLATALAAFYQQIPVGHVEAGLRTRNRYDPFPEEMNRRLTAPLAALHFAATPQARENLLRESIPAETIYVTGNPVIDALQRIAAQTPPPLAEVVPEAALAEGQRLLLVTAHRRENWGEPLRHICQALRRLAETYPQVQVVYALHRNPVVREAAREVLQGCARVHLIEPPDYAAFVHLMKRAYLILTDSGGLQEEAPALGVPVLVLRRTTERPEGIAAGTARLVGTDPEAIVAAARELLEQPAAHAAMAQAVNPYGDGRAAARIAAAIKHYLGRTATPPEDFSPSVAPSPLGSTGKI